MGRGSADMIVKEDEVLLRASRFQGQLRNGVSPIANPNRAFLQLSKLQQKVSFGALKKQGQFSVKNVQVKFLIEYDLTNPETQLSPPIFNGSVRLYRLLPSPLTTSDNLKVDSNVENLKLIVAQENFSNLDQVSTINFINGFIDTCNSKLKTKTGVVLFNVLEDRFPIFFRPTPLNYNLMKTSTDSFTKSNLSAIYQSIKLNTNDKRGGWGLIIEENKTGQPLQLVIQSFRDRINSAVPETYGLMGANYLYLLSQFSSIPGKEKINFDNSLYGFNEEQKAQPTTYSYLLKQVSNKRQAFRGLAIWHLERLVPDGQKIGYDPTDEEPAREISIKKWRDKLTELKKLPEPLPASKPPVAKPAAPKP